MLGMATSMTIAFPALQYFHTGGGTPYNGLMMGRLRPKRVPFSGLQVHERVGISPVTVYENVGKSVLSVCNRPKMANRCIL